MGKPWWDEEIGCAKATLSRLGERVDHSFALGFLEVKYDHLAGLYAAAKAAHANVQGELDRLKRAVRAVLRTSDADNVNEEAELLAKEEVQHVG